MFNPMSSYRKSYRFLCLEFCQGSPTRHRANVSRTHNKLRPRSRLSGSSVPEIRPWLQYPPETTRHSSSCIAMQPRTNHQERFQGLGRGKTSHVWPGGRRNTLKGSQAVPEALLC